MLTVYRLRRQFKQLLEDNHNVCPGKSLNEVAIFFLGRECFSILSEEDKQSVYEQHQSELREKAKHEFHELLFEHAEFFAKLSPRTQITPDDFKEINERLQNELRWVLLRKCLQTLSKQFMTFYSALQSTPFVSRMKPNIQYKIYIDILVKDIKR